MKNFYSTIDADDFRGFDPFGDDLGYTARFIGDRDDDNFNVELVDNETGDSLYF